MRAAKGYIMTERQMDQNAIGAFIQSLRKEQGLTQKDLGSRLGVTNSTISRWEKGDSYPDAGMYEPLSRALGVSVAELLSGRRISDSEYRKAADQQIISLAQENEGGGSRLYRPLIVLSGFLSVLLIIIMLLHESGLIILQSQAKYIAAFFILSILIQICSGCMPDLFSGIRRFLSDKSDNSNITDEIRAMKTAVKINAGAGIIISIISLDQAIRFFHDSTRLMTYVAQALDPIIIAVLLDLILIAMAYFLGSGNALHSHGLLTKKVSFAALFSVAIISYFFLLCSIQMYPDGKLYDDAYFTAQKSEANDTVMFYFKTYKNIPIKVNADAAFSAGGHLTFNGISRDLSYSYYKRSTSFSALRNSTGADLRLLDGSGFEDRDNLAIKCGTGQLRSIRIYLSDISCYGHRIRCDVIYPVAVVSPKQMINEVDSFDPAELKVSSFVTSYHDRCYLADGKSDGSRDAFINDRGVIYHLSSDMSEAQLKKWINGL